MSAKATATFDANDSPIQAAFRRVDKQLLGLEKKFAHVAKFAAEMFAVPAAAAVVMGVGIAKAMDVGSELDDLSARTGVAAGDLAKLGQEFKNAGKDAADIGPLFNKMQKAIATGSGDSTIAKLGLNLRDLKNSAPIDQFHAIGEAINRINDPAQKAAAAMDLFGKSGGGLLQVFAVGGFGKAAEEVGGQAAILNRDAALFHEVSKELALAGLKVQGFFMGVADQVAPVLKPILDGLANIDFSQMGQQLGSVAALFIGMFSDGKYSEIIFASTKIALMNAANFWLDSWKAMGAIISQILVEVGKNFVMVFQILTDPNFWKGMGNQLLGIAKSFIGMMLDGVAMMLDKLKNIPGLGKIGGAADAVRAQANQYRAGGKESLDTARGQAWTSIGERAMARMGDALKNIGTAGFGEFGKSKLFDTSKDQSALDKIWAGISSNVQAVSEKSLAEAKGAPSGLPGIDMDMGAKVGVNSLQRIGGGGGAGSGGDPLLYENQRQTGILAKIEQHLAPKNSRGGGFVTVFG